MLSKRPGSSPRQAPSLDDLIEVLKAPDKDWLYETLQKRVHRLNVSFETPFKHSWKHKRASTDEGEPECRTSSTAVGPHDLTAAHLSEKTLVSGHVALFRAKDWEATPLGSMATWSPQLRRTVNFLLVDPRAAVVYWGPQKICLYNESYTGLLAEKHPWALGKTVKEVWPETADAELATAFAKADESGQSSRGDRAPFYVNRRGFLEELVGDWGLVPVIGGDANLGYYNTVSDLTHQIQNLNEFWPSIMEGLENNREDIPFAAVYSALPKNQANSRTSSVQGLGPDPDSLLSTRAWSLEGTLGVQSNSEAFPSHIDSEFAQEHITKAFKDCMATGKTHIINLKPGTPLHRAARSRAYGDQCNAAILIPLGRALDGDRIGFLLLGLSSRRDYDLAYKQFTRLLARQLCSSLTMVRQAEDDARKANMQAELAALDRMMLSEKLALTEQQARDNEKRFRSIAGHLPIAMYELSPTGDLLFANDSYYELTGIDPNNLYPYCWVDTIHEADKQVYQENWELLAAGEPVRFEARLKMPFFAGDVLNGETIEGETWVLSAGYSQKASDGSIKSIQGAVIDISRQKMHETYQEQRLKEAIELKRQQEMFMDFVGHEIRNPLSATSLCASSIQTTLEDLLRDTTLEDTTDTIRIDRETVRNQIENADIITTCIQHQKRIIDDVLTLSKLDSGLLVVSPCEVKTTDLIAKCLRLFEAEIAQADMDMEFRIDQSYEDLGVDWVMLDPSRLLQILINLLTNAIRFTRNEAKREITVTLAASESRPEISLAGIQYLRQPNATQEDMKPELSSEDGDTVYLLISVQDSGCGMKENELERIFERFLQSSHKTHVEYGGSGLGLFISRELVRMQGGKIGVASTHRVGSTFEFYIRVSRCAAPKQAVSESLQRTTASSQSSTHVQHRTRSGTELQQAPTHILLVEDNLVNQRVMATQLRKTGYTVTLANHGAEALDFIRTSTFCDSNSDSKLLDIVLMDVEMPVMGGLDCTRRIRAMQASGEVSSHVPIIAITANARGEQQTQALDAGMDAVVTKPFKMQELLAVVERVWRTPR